MMKPETLTWIAAKDRNKKKIRGIQMTSDGRKYRARIHIIGVDGKPKQRVAAAHTLAEAKRKLDDLKTMYKEGGAELLDAQRITWAQLAKAYEDDHLFKPQYDDASSDERHKTGGLVSVGDAKRALKVFGDFINKNRLIRTIDAIEIKRFKLMRSKTKKERGGGNRSIASVNRDLNYVRHAFNFARRKKWLTSNPMTGEKLIVLKHEKKRDRVITWAEQDRLLEATVTLGYEYLRMTLTFLIDSGLRIGELKLLQRDHVKLDQGLHGHLYLPARITKGKEKRDLPILTPSACQIIEKRLTMIPNDPKALIFGAEWNNRKVRDQFDATTKLAGVDGLQLRDTRHTFATRSISIIPMGELMKMTGHTEIKTLLRYINPTQESFDRSVKAYATMTAKMQEPMASDQVN
jgi:integrase